MEKLFFKVQFFLSLLIFICTLIESVKLFCCIYLPDGIKLLYAVIPVLLFGVVRIAYKELKSNI